MDGAREMGTNATALPPEQLARRRWMAVLARASAVELEAALHQLDGVPAYRLIRRPELGMAMVRGRAGGTGRVFNLGEMTMTRCTLRTADGLIGAAYVAGRDQRQAELAALFDGLLQDPRRQAAILITVIEPLALAQADRRNRRVARAAETRVDFFTVVRGEDRS